MNRLGIIDKANKRGRFGGHLGWIIKFDRIATIKRRWVLSHWYFQNPIQLSGANSLRILIVDIINQSKDFCHHLNIYLDPKEENEFFKRFDLNGDKMLQYINLSYQGLAFDDNIQDVSNMEFLHLDVWTPDLTKLKTFLINLPPHNQI